MQYHAYRCLYGSRVTSEVPPSKKTAPKDDPSWLSFEGREMRQEIHGETRQEIHESHQRFWRNLFRDKWRRCLWCWKWGMVMIEHRWRRYNPYELLLPDAVDSIQYYDSRDCFLCGPCWELPEPSWYHRARQQCMRALADGAIMPQAIRGTEDVLQIVSAFVIGCYVDPCVRVGIGDDGYRYSA